MQQLNYRYRNLPIPGGGYATGFLFHEKEPGCLYLRTDIGGVYRFEKETETWSSLIDHVSNEDIRETFPSAIALDPQNPQKLYTASGIFKQPHGLLTISEDGGRSSEKIELPFMVHGNLNGRGTGSRLIVSHKDPSVLYYASQEDGLWKSASGGRKWKRLTAMPERHLTFVAETCEGNVLVVGSAGVTTKRSETLRGYGLYVSYDGGKTFLQMWQPEDGEVQGIRLAGLVPQRYSEDEEYFYVTFSVMGYDAFALENGYSCDGGSVVGGKIVRYPKTPDVTPWQGEEITPAGLEAYLDGNHLLQFGFGGICAAAGKSGLLAVSSLCKQDGDCIWRSFDHGSTWECILHGLDTGRMEFRSHYMRPEYNGGLNLIHWLSDLKINPFDEKELWFNTGTGVFRTKNLTGDTVVFSDWCDGLEETVHLNLYSPPAGDVKLIDILGDLGGFAFTKLDETPDNSFADADGNRYITCLNADYSDVTPSIVIVTPRGNWKGKTKGGLILSKDQCRTFQRLPMPFGLSEEIDGLLRRIETPNVNSGWAAISPDGKNILWSIAKGNDLPASTVVASQDGGGHFVKVKITDAGGRCISDEPESPHHLKVFSDRTDGDMFYGFGEKGQFYVSADGGLSFQEKTLPEEFPKIEMGLVDCANKTEIRPDNGFSGRFYLALGKEGLWKLVYDKASDRVCVSCLSREGDIFYRLGLGVGRPGGDYLREAKMMYVAAEIGGEYGFFRTEDEGKSFVRLNSEKQMYGEINSVEGDSQVFGRFYLGTGSRGVLYGEPEGV